ncbi:MAG: ATP-binding protein [Sphaerochaeta sp.]|nr:ATP-binding protein [Sphaerochaeta sp.]
MVADTKIRKKDRDTIIQALRAGVVPKFGLHLIQVGRKLEVQALLSDIERISDGGSSIRFIIGEYGSGKTFFLNLIRTIAMEKGLVTASADLNPSRRLFSTSGQSKSLYMELVRNLSTRTKPDGGALVGIVEKFIANTRNEAKATSQTVEELIQKKLNGLTELVCGFDFAQVVTCYYQGFEQGNDELKNDAIKWLRGEFSTKTDARKALGVRNIIDDATYYDQLKLLAKFIRISGYAGLMVCMDEMVNIYKLANTVSRGTNYEQLLRILNDCLQGNTEGIGFMFGGTPEFYLDTRRGMFSYDALRSRLAQNSFSNDKYKDLSGPVIKLESLTPEDLYVLLENINFVYASGKEDDKVVPDEALPEFMRYCSNRLGNSYFRTPRTTITAFINLLAILEQNKDAGWKELIGSLEVRQDNGGIAEKDGVIEDDELATFRL